MYKNYLSARHLRKKSNIRTKKEYFIDLLLILWLGFGDPTSCTIVCMICLALAPPSFLQIKIGHLTFSILKGIYSKTKGNSPLR